MLHSNTPTVKPQTASPNVFALFSSSLANDLNCLSINAETGSIESLVPVQGPAKQYFSKLYGESTREYPFDSKRGRFHFLDIDQKGATSSSPITLYSIDPSTGDSTATTITGATGFVVSFVYHAESASLIFATGFREASQFDFYTLDPDTATATAISTVHRGESESSSAAFYSPYITEVSSSGKTVLRLGYKEVVVGNSPGLGSTPLDGNATATWQSVPGPANEEFFYSLVRRPGTDKFLSLTPSTRFNHTFSVVEWDTTGDDPKVVLEVPDAHPPSTSSTGVLGYVVDTATADSYAALVVKKGPVPLGLEDKWELISLDLNSGEGNSKAITGKGFDPLGAETVTVSGIGIKTA